MSEPRESSEAIARAASALEAEVRRRNQWYGLDNWTFEEVARWVLNAAVDRSEVPMPEVNENQPDDLACRYCGQEHAASAMVVALSAKLERCRGPLMREAYTALALAEHEFEALCEAAQTVVDIVDDPQTDVGSPAFYGAVGALRDALAGPGQKEGDSDG